MSSIRSGRKDPKARKPGYPVNSKSSIVREENMSDELRKKLDKMIELYSQRAANGLPLFKKNE